MAGKLVHIEFPAQDTDRGTRFYSQLFGWEFRDSGMPGIDYRMFDGGGGWGGAVADFFSAVTNVSASTLQKNLAVGGDATNGGRGGDGFGGGAFNDGTSSLTLTNSLVTDNHANGGGPDGQGIGGGVYNLGALAVDVLTRVRKNHASTSDDDIFG